MVLVEQNIFVIHFQQVLKNRWGVCAFGCACVGLRLCESFRVTVGLCWCLRDCTMLTVARVQLKRTRLTYVADCCAITSSLDVWANGAMDSMVMAFLNPPSFK